MPRLSIGGMFKCEEMTLCDFILIPPSVFSIKMTFDPDTSLAITLFVLPGLVCPCSHLPVPHEDSPVDHHCLVA